MSWWRGLQAQPQPSRFPYSAEFRLWDPSPAWGSQAQACCSAHCPHSRPLPGPTQPHPQAQRSPAPHCQPPSHTGLPSEGHWPPSPESPLQVGFGSFLVAGQHPAARVACPPSFLMGPGVAPEGAGMLAGQFLGLGLCPLLRDRVGWLCGQASALFRLLEKSQSFYQQKRLHTGITDNCNSGQESHSKNCKHIRETKGKMLLCREKGSS